MVAMSRIPPIQPADFNMAPNASATGGIDYGFVDPCLKSGRRIIAADPSVLDFMKQEHARAHSHRATAMAPINVPTPDVVISGNVTVGEDGKPVADITITEEAVAVKFQKRAHNPLLVAAGFDKMGIAVPWLGGKRLRFIFG